MISASRPRVVLLAAGQGKRMGPLGDDEPKSLLPVAGEPFAVRLIRQAVEHGIDDVTVVVGFRAQYLQDVLSSQASVPLRFVVNDLYAKDVNIHSLALALTADPSPCFVVEADIWMSDAAWDEMLRPDDASRSVWYSRGSFMPHQMGGILHADADRNITDIRIVPAYEARYADYEKLVGVTKIGPHQAAEFAARLVRARDANMAQYWLNPWIDDLAALPCVARNVGPEHAVSVNTPEEYRRLLEQVGR